VPGERIRIFAKEPVAGGSLDGAGGAGWRYMVRGGRMFEEHFVCTFDLLSSIPSIDNEGLNLKSKRDRPLQPRDNLVLTLPVGARREEIGGAALGTRGKGPVRYCGYSSAPKARSRNARSQGWWKVVAWVSITA
jgi:hypothetical protein